MKKEPQDGLPGHSHSDSFFSEEYMDPNYFPEDDYEGYEDMEALWEPDYDDRLDRYVDQEEWWGDVDDYLDKYGVENVFQNEDIKEKAKETCLEKYGFTNFAQADALIPCDNLKVGDKKWRWEVKRVFLEDYHGSNCTFCDVVCECGNEAKIRMTAIVNGWSKSCGCLRDETSRLNGQTSTLTHGMSDERIYKIWAWMKTRCGNPNQPAYKYYGERGITVCNEWKDSFECFLIWSYENGYNDELTIDRIDNSKGYNPENCRWATYHEQAMNRCDTIHINITAWGETKDGHDWVIDPRCSVSLGTICYRLGAGWPPEKAISR